MSVRTLYLKASSYSIAAKIFTVLASLGVLWLLNKIAGKEIFGYLMLAYALNYILASAVATLFQTIMMFHVSRDHKEDEGPAHMGKVSAALIFGIIFGIVIAFAEVSLAKPLALSMNKPDAAFWYASMAWMVPAFAAISILTTWYRSKQDVPTMVTYFEILPAAARVLLLGMALLLAWPVSTIALIYVLSFLLPFFLLYAKNPVPLRAGFRSFTFWDLKYGAQNMVTQLMTKSIRNLVIFMIGFFASAGVVAEYTLAMRFGQFLQIPKLALTQLQVPRMGAYLKQGKTEELRAEFDSLRMLGLAATILGGAFFLIAAPYVFSLFGEYDGAYPIFLVLFISSIVLTGFGAVGGYLSMAGYAGLSLVINAVSLALLVVSIVLFVPFYGGVGAAIATLIGSLSSMALMAAAILWKDKLNTLGFSSLITMGVSAVIITLAITGMTPYWLSALLLVILTGYGLYKANSAFLIAFSGKSGEQHGG